MNAEPAAFRRLSVETVINPYKIHEYGPAAFRRLSVETSEPKQTNKMQGPAAFRRLSVETYEKPCMVAEKLPSRLQAAEC